MNQKQFNVSHLL